MPQHKITKMRLETDSLGEVAVPSHYYFGAQTQRATLHFNINSELMPQEIIQAIGIVKKAAAITNYTLRKLPKSKCNLILKAANEVIAGKLTDHFPLQIWQSGSGTQTNMNVNEVIANRAIEIAGGVLGSKKPVHPNDDVNMSQSTNDVFPTAMHIAATKLSEEQLFPAIIFLKKMLSQKQKEFKNVTKIGRTHLQDAVALTLGQEFSGYVAELEICLQNLKLSTKEIKKLAIGGTAVGTGLNAPKKFAGLMAKNISVLTKIKFSSAKNKFQALASHEPIALVSGSLKTLATTLFKIANDIRFLASGPRCGIGELILPDNEPGSSIMPGKVNPTQCEMLTMIAAQVMGNDSVISFANSQGNLELNVFKPVIIYNLLQSIKLLASGMKNFARYAIKDLKINNKKIAYFVENSLMRVTELTPEIGYDKAAKIAKTALKENITLHEARVKLGYLTKGRSVVE
jgi:fumarate hydratase, class II